MAEDAEKTKLRTWASSSPSQESEPLLRSITPRIFTLDNHDEAYYLWKDAAVGDATVVHLDAHHDLFEVEGDRVPCIADYLRWSLKEGIAREIYWVVPRPAWESRAGRENIEGHLKALGGTGGGGRSWFKPAEEIGQVTLYGRTVTACSIRSLPAIQSPLLLDIDVDYLLLDVPPFSACHRVPERPWIWPGELAAELNDLARRAEKVTICYSVAGAYTPLMWKHLGDDLAAILAAEHPEGATAYAELKRRMAEALLDGDTARHAELREAAEEKNPEDASLHYWRALAELDSGRTSAAREACARAIELDPTYAYSFGCGGPIFEVHGDFEGAERAYQKATDLNERDALGWYGLGRASLRRGDRAGARLRLGTAAALPDAPSEVHRELAALAESEGDREEALREYRTYLRMSYAGRSLDRPPAARPDPTYRSPFWSEGYSGLARLYSAQGSSRASANCYAEALKLTNPRLYRAARPILRKMAGDADVSAPVVAASAVKALFVGAGLGARYLGRGVKRKLRAARRREGSAMHAAVRICPPIPIRRAAGRLQER